MIGVKPTSDDRAALQRKLGETDIESALSGEVEKVQTLGATTGTTAMAQVYIYQPPELPPETPAPMIYGFGSSHQRKNFK